MKLRGRFTVTLALAALVPISIAAVIATRVFSSKLRENYVARREQANDVVKRELARLDASVHDAAASLASTDHPYVGSLLIDLDHANGSLDPDKNDGWISEARRRIREQAGPTMKGLSLDLFSVTGPDDIVLVSPHLRAQLGDPLPSVRKRADATKGKPFFTKDAIWTGHTAEQLLVIESAQTVRSNRYTVAVIAGKRVTDDLLALVRNSQKENPDRTADKAGLGTDARIVAPSGEVLLPPSAGDDGWAKLAKDPPIRTPLLGPEGTPVAYVEVAVSDGGLDHLLFNITLTAALLALGALGTVILIGSLVARRTARDLDQLVEGSVAAARGNLDYRVPVRASDEVGAVASAFNFMMEDLKTSKEKLVIAERIAAWQEIARRLAHEIKNPLTPIQMAMDTLRKSHRKQHPDFAEILEESTTTVLEEADRLKRIVAEFSDFARMPKPEFNRTDLNDIIHSALALYKDATPRVEEHLDPQLPELDADKGQIHQVLLNLVENGRDALGTREGGRVIVTTRRGDSDRLTLVVEDNGPGVPGELKDKVFAPYFTTKITKGGTGLGLAIVHRIISDHGGRITVSDAPGGGARFTIELPLHNGQALLASRSSHVA